VPKRDKYGVKEHEGCRTGFGVQSIKAPVFFLESMIKQLSTTWALWARPPEVMRARTALFPTAQSQK
jgi:hypothetical protein